MIKQGEQRFSFVHFAKLLFQNRKKAGMYGLLFIAISCNICLFLPGGMHSSGAGHLVNAVQLICFFAMGVINVWAFYRKKFMAAFSSTGDKLAFIALLFIIMAIVLFVYYYLAGNNNLSMVFASSSAFLLPFLLIQSWMAYLHIPAKDYPIWQLPEEARPMEGALPSYAGNMQVQLKLLRGLRDNLENIFPVAVPEKLKLGRMFERFLAQQYQPGDTGGIALKDERQQPFGWQFYESRYAGLWQRNLDPARSMRENRLRPNATINVVRLRMPH